MAHLPSPTTDAAVMDRMWSPWRSDYVSKFDSGRRPSSDEASIFSRLASEDADEENLIVWRGEHVFVVMNLHPYNNGHLLVVPYREVGRYDRLTSEEQQAIASAIDRCIGWLREALAPDGFNVGMNLGRAAGASIEEHLHVHVVPRWDRDTNFMTSTTDTRVLPEDLATTYQKLRRAVDGSARSSPDSTEGSA
jgi:ATP adenylyltransferase